MSRKFNQQLGFTLLELLLSVAVIGALASLSLPVYRTLIKKNDLDVTANTAISLFRRAQILSQSVDGDSPWGVSVQNNSFILFKGSSFSSRDTTFDETADIPTTITIGSTSVTIFTKLTGFTSTTTVIDLSTEGDTKSLSINEKGIVGF